MSGAARRVLYLHGGAAFHPSDYGAKILGDILAKDGRYTLEVTTDLDVLATLPDADWDAVVIYTTGYHDELTPAREAGLVRYVQGGGGLVGIHSAADSFRGSQAYLDLLGAEFETHPPLQRIPVTIHEDSHYITTRVPEFEVTDELYLLKGVDLSRELLLASTRWQGKPAPLLFVHPYGEGRVSYLALGHTHETWRDPAFQKLLLRSVGWVTGEVAQEGEIRCGILGYGGAFNMGRSHAGWIDAQPGMRTVAMCDVDPQRVAVAKEELPTLDGYYTDADDLLAHDGLDLVVVILPHNLHAPLALKCLQAGKHVILEKPMCVTVDEANALIDVARERDLMLSVFHNRRWDGDYQTIQQLIARGVIGEVFHLEAGIGGYRHPGFWWRSDKAVSGGVLYDWGAHFVDWMLNLVPSPVAQVMGDLQKRVWHAVTNADHGEIIIRWENGVTASFWTSSIAASVRPKWRILGTQGAIEAPWSGPLQVTSMVKGARHEGTVDVTLPGYGAEPYYRNVADHLLFGEALAVTGESARRVIAVIQAAQESAKLGRSVPLAPGCE
ncbi:MAG: ThuA domain-containing protein [Anaerolineae bacterium]